MNQRDAGRYSITAGIRASLTGDWSTYEAGLAREMSTEVAKSMGRSPSAERAFFVPFSALTRATYVTSGATTGGNLRQRGYYSRDDIGHAQSQIAFVVKHLVHQAERRKTQQEPACDVARAAGNGDPEAQVVAGNPHHREQRAGCRLAVVQRLCAQLAIVGQQQANSQNCRSKDDISEQPDRGRLLPLHSGVKSSPISAAGALCVRRPTET